MPKSILHNAHVQIEVVRRAVIDTGVTLQELRTQLERCAHPRFLPSIEEAIAYYEVKMRELERDLEQLTVRLELEDAPRSADEALILEELDRCDDRGLTTLSPRRAWRLWAAFVAVAGMPYLPRAAAWIHYGLEIVGVGTLRLTISPDGSGTLHLHQRAPRIELETPSGVVEVQADPLGGWCLTLHDASGRPKDTHCAPNYRRIAELLDGLGGTIREPHAAVG